MEPQYNIIFRGTIAEGCDLAEVKRKLAVLYKVEVAQVERLFSGQPVTLKKHADYQTAMKY